MEINKLNMVLDYVEKNKEVIFNIISYLKEKVSFLEIKKIHEVKMSEELVIKNPLYFTLNIIVSKKFNLEEQIFVIEFYLIIEFVEKNLFFSYSLYKNYVKNNEEKNYFFTYDDKKEQVILKKIQEILFE